MFLITHISFDHIFLSIPIYIIYIYKFRCVSIEENAVNDKKLFSKMRQTVRGKPTIDECMYSTAMAREKERRI